MKDNKMSVNDEFEQWYLEHFKFNRENDAFGQLSKDVAMFTWQAAVAKCEAIMKDAERIQKENIKKAILTAANFMFESPEHSQYGSYWQAMVDNVEIFANLEPIFKEDKHDAKN